MAEWVPTDLIRLLPGRVWVDGVRAKRRDALAMYTLERAGLGATAEKPLYVYADGQIEFFPSTADRWQYHYIREADEVTSNDSRLQVDERFEAAMMFYVAGKVLERMGRREEAAYAMQLYEDEIAPYLDEIIAGDVLETETEVA